MGLGRGARFLQQVAGATVDGQVGEETIGKVNSTDPDTLIKEYSDVRIDRYKTIVENNPSQEQFLDGWIRRVAEVSQFAVSNQASA
jgi:lysozyme family protein